MSEGFLARWSRRKRGAAVPEEDVAAVTTDDTTDLVPLAPEAPPPETPLATLACESPGEMVAAAAENDTPASALPSLESLTIDSDVTAFLRPGVPTPLRQAALRRMWSLDIGIRDFCGPADYAWDYNVEGGVPGSSLSMAGNLRAMLAQVVGRTEAQLAAYDAGEADNDAGATPGEAPATEPPPVLAETGPLDLPTPLEPPAFVPPAVAAAAWPTAPAPAMEADTEPAHPPARRRRHGRALPA